MTKVIVAFRNFAKAPKNASQYFNYVILRKTEKSPNVTIEMLYSIIHEHTLRNN